MDDIGATNKSIERMNEEADSESAAAAATTTRYSLDEMHEMVKAKLNEPESIGSHKEKRLRALERTFARSVPDSMKDNDTVSMIREDRDR